ncbi:hypothetical protein CRYO30217_02872 [Parvicella tangerina]|uniref:Glycosyltransferase RgtA/B/C/D-like domain-containing protein n=2 Tax=Parvicella tangerina TaxID=2829795 RepID=A0A916JPZ5_9FLAO|nr:hypothetical protein CRYO30217_02872 [Parvicella tangerina]
MVFEQFIVLSNTMSSVGNKIKQSLFFRGNRSDSLVIYGTLLLILVKLILFPFTQTVDADAVSRTLISYNWLKNPHFITDSVWAPLHFYLNGAVMWITGSIEDGPRILNIFLSGLMIIPFYFFVKREFNEQGAVYSAALVALSPVIFRNSFQALSGTPYLFFLAMGLFFFSRALRSSSFKFYVIAGLSITLAAGFRYEAWIIIAVFTLIGIIRKQWKGTAVFWGVAMIVPAGWMLIGQVYHGDFLYGVNGAYGWNIEQMDVNANVNDTERLKRLFFFPMSWFLAVSPILAWVIIVSFIRKTIKKAYSLQQFLWLLPLAVIGLAFLVKAQDGTLLLQHRFTGSLVLLSAPLLATVLDVKSKRFSKPLMFLAVLLILPQSYFWYRVNLDEWPPMSRQIKSVIKDIQLSTGPETLPLPQIDNPLLTGGLEAVKNNWNKEDGLILDFFGWTETYYFALQYPKADPFIFPGAKNDVFPTEKYLNYVLTHPKGKLVMHCASNHQEFVTITSCRFTLNGHSEVSLRIESLYNEKGFQVYEYQLAQDQEFVDDIADEVCFSSGSVAYFESKAYFNVQLKESAKRLARKESISLEAGIHKLAEELAEKYKKGEIEL